MWFWDPDVSLVWPGISDPACLATMFLIIRRTEEHKHRTERLHRRKWNPWTFLLWAKAASRWVTIEIQQKAEAMPIRCLQSAGMCERVDADGKSNETATVFMLLVIVHWDFCWAPLPHWKPGYAEAAWHDDPQARLLMWSTSDTGALDHRQEIKDTGPRRSLQIHPKSGHWEPFVVNYPYFVCALFLLIRYGYLFCELYWIWQTYIRINNCNFRDQRGTVGKDSCPVHVLQGCPAHPSQHACKDARPCTRTHVSHL